VVFGLVNFGEDRRHRMISEENKLYRCGAPVSLKLRERARFMVFVNVSKVVGGC
jgi:hypothetical protein